MLWAVAGLLVGLWVLALLASLKLGGLIHVLPVIAAFVILRRLTQGPDAPVAKRGNGIQPAYRRR